MTNSKPCSSCKQQLPLESFCRNKRTSDGLNIYCRKCARDKYLAKRAQILLSKQNYYLANADRLADYRKKYYAQNRLRLLAEKKEFYLNNKTRLQEKNKEYAKNNREKLNAWLRDYTIRKPEVISRKRATRRLKIKSNSFLIRKRELQKIYSSPCYVCGTTESITVDHIIPIAKGGTHSVGNLLPLCLSCNTSKQDRLLYQFLMERRKNK